MVRVPDLYAHSASEGKIFSPPKKNRHQRSLGYSNGYFFLPGCAFPLPRRADGTPLPPRGSCWGSKLASALTSLISYVSLLEPEPERCEPPVAGLLRLSWVCISQEPRTATK